MQVKRQISRVAIFADESANWVIGGLRQIDRLIFALEESAQEEGSFSPRNIDVLWDPDLALAHRRLPSRSYGNALQVREFDGRELPSEDAEEQVSISTRLLPKRNALRDIASQLNGARNTSEVNAELSRICSPATCKMVNAPADLALAEAWLMRSLGKSQDGWVARNIARRVSIPLSRLLLRLHVKPMHATIGGSLFGLAGALVLLNGGYGAILTGALLLCVFNILDGCDGEIARVKYLDSAAGRRLDLVVDTAVNILFLVCLGLGLARTEVTVAAQSFWIREGLATGALIVATEAMLLLGRRGGGAGAGGPSKLYDRHARMLGRSGALSISPKLVHFFVQVTKRDVAWLAFAFLAAIGAAQWILHLSFVVALLAASASALALSRRPMSPLR